MKKDLLILQELFNKTFDFNKLKFESESRLKEYFENEQSIIFNGYDKSEIDEIKNASLEYSGTQVIINSKYNKLMYGLKFEVYITDEIFPNYIYKVWYDSNGYFQKIDFKKY